MGVFLTFIVPVYKIKKELLCNCIESIINQNSNEYQVILIDDGSPDCCGDICDEYACQYLNVKVIHQKNNGVASARNAGIMETETPWVTFVDADDWLEKNTIQKILSVIKNEAVGADIVMFDYFNDSKNGSEIASLNRASGFCVGKLLQECQRGPFFKMFNNGKLTPFSIAAIWNKVYRTEFLRENRIFFASGVKRGEDLLFNADALNATDKIYYANYGYYHYRWSAESATNRYTPDVVEITKQEIQGLKQQVQKHRLSDTVSIYLDCRICTRLYSCIRLYYFHPENPDSMKKNVKKLKLTAESEPFAEAIKKTTLKYYTLQEKIFVFMLKQRWYFGCGLLTKLRAQILGLKNFK